MKPFAKRKNSRRLSAPDAPKQSRPAIDGSPSVGANAPQSHRSPSPPSPRSPGSLSSQKPNLSPGKASRRKRRERVPARFSFSPRTKVTLTVRGFNQKRLIASLTDGGVTLFDVRRESGDVLHVTVYEKQCVKTFAICESMCYTYNMESRTGLLAYLHAASARCGVAAGGLLFAAVMALAGGRCLGIETEGLSEVSRREVLSAVGGAGAHIGARLTELDRDKIRSSVNALDGVAECSVHIRGTTLVVKVLERDRSEPHEAGASVITAECDAVVTRVVVRSGTARVRAGDVVKEGDVLIEGATYGSDGEKLADEEARGEVYGVVTRRLTRAVQSSAYRYTRTGRSRTVTSLRLFGARIGARPSPYEHSESVTSAATLGGLLPLRVERTTYFELGLVPDERTADEIAAELVEQAKAESFLSGCEAVTHVETLEGGVQLVTVYLRAERKISAQTGGI